LTTTLEAAPPFKVGKNYIELLHHVPYVISVGGVPEQQDLLREFISEGRYFLRRDRLGNA
jgi:hypothetical protein